ncbi:MAG: GGDEF domain-containing protein [Sciscionella sp.]
MRPTTALPATRHRATRRTPADPEAVIAAQRAYIADLEAALHAARTDSLTGLPTRATWTHRAATRYTDPTMLLGLLDLDNFKTINDQHGHDAGDAVLTETGHRLTHQLPQGLTGRLGGDEFVFLAPWASDGWEHHLDTLSVALSVPIALPARGVEVTVTASIGVATTHDILLPNPELGHLTKAADLAMYRAKRSTSRHWARYAPTDGGITPTLDHAPRRRTRHHGACPDPAAVATHTRTTDHHT